MASARPAHRDLPNLNLVPWRERQRRARLQRGLRILAAIGAAFSIVLMLVLGQQLAERARLANLLSEVAAERTQTSAASAHAVLLLQAQTLYAQQQPIDSLRQYLAALSREMPNDVELTQIRLDHDILQLQGRALHMEAITELQQRLRIQNAGFVVLEQIQSPLQARDPLQFSLRIELRGAAERTRTVP